MDEAPRGKDTAGGFNSWEMWGELYRRCDPDVTPWELVKFAELPVNGAGWGCLIDLLGWISSPPALCSDLGVLVAAVDEWTENSGHNRELVDLEGDGELARELARWRIRTLGDLRDVFCRGTLHGDDDPILPSGKSPRDVFSAIVSMLGGSADIASMVGWLVAVRMMWYRLPPVGSSYKYTAMGYDEAEKQQQKYGLEVAPVVLWDPGDKNEGGSPI